MVQAAAQVKTRLPESCYRHVQADLQQPKQSKPGKGRLWPLPLLLPPPLLLRYVVFCRHNPLEAAYVKVYNTDGVQLTARSKS